MNHDPAICGRVTLNLLARQLADWVYGRSANRNFHIEGTKLRS
jgi:hypothetical protein